MIRRYGFSLAVLGALVVMAAGSARAGIVGHISRVPIGPALPELQEGSLTGGREGAVEMKMGEETPKFQQRGPVETGNLPESVQLRSHEPRFFMKNGKHLDRRIIDAGP